MQLLVDRSGEVIADHIRPAHSHWTRMKGLLGTKSLPPGHGLWIRPCRQVHMYFMRYPIDLLFLDQRDCVVAVIESQPINSISPKFDEANSVVELPAGSLAQHHLEVGQRLRFEGATHAGGSDRLATAGTWLANLLMACLYLLFAYHHVIAAIQLDRFWAIAPLVVQQAMLVVLYLVRRPARSTSTQPVDWLLGFFGTGLPLLLRPTIETSAWVAWLQPIQLIGASIVALGTVSLGRRFAIVAGNHGIKRSGLHGVVRHPIYLGCLLTYFGYVGIHPSAGNIAIVLVEVVLLHLRMAAEERALVNDPEYREYREHVRWRLLPGVY